MFGLVFFLANLDEHHVEYDRDHVLFVYEQSATDNMIQKAVYVFFCFEKSANQTTCHKKQV